MRRRSRSRPPIVSDWSDLRYFLEAARTRSHTAAARRLGVEHTTVARRLQRLARDYGTPLLERARDGWEPTEAGRQLMAHAEAMEAASIAAAEELAGGPAAVAGTVRLGVPEVLGARILTPRLPPLLAQYPELHIELLLLPRSPSLAAREADLTVTLEPPRSGRYYVTRFTQLRYDLYGSTDYLAQHRPIRQRSDVAGHRFVDYVQDYLLSDSLRYLDELGLDPQRVFAATGMQAQYEAIRCSLGIGMLARYLVQPESPLVRVLPAEMW
ncbi:MAG TPA: LysR family transcriptional regulator, partial [Burkholderiaceae bacterium]|nr:LysR family transcriptional regulator [Burkholderiaceae bacterium]